MATAAQIEANRKNAKKSTGPKTPAGKDRSKMNSLKHGLRSEQVVLPGESAEEFHAELKGWRDDWQPRTHTQAVLCERAAAASWRMRRCVRAEADLLLETADRRARRRRDGDGDGDGDGGARDRVELASEMLHHEPAAALAELRSFPEGVDYLLREWGKLGDLLDEAWDVRGGHWSLMLLTGHDLMADPAAAGPMAADSHRLALANEAEDDDDDDEEALPAGEAGALGARLRMAVARHRDELRAHRRTLAPPPAGGGAPDDELKLVAVSRQVLLLHRYELAHERSMRSAMRDLMALERAGFGGGRRAEEDSEAVAAKKVGEKKSDPASRPAASSGGGETGPTSAPSEPKPRGSRGARNQPRRDQKGRTWPVEGAGGGGSPS